jgi:hypothetical protein
LVFVLAAVPGTTPPVRQLVLCYANLPYPTIPLSSGWHSADAIPGTFLKPVIVRPSSPTYEDPVAIAVGPGGGVLTLAQADTSLGKDWVVTGWNPAGSAYVKTDSTLGPAGSLPTFQDLFAAALGTDPDGNVIVTGSGKNASPDADFATVRYAAGAALVSPIGFHQRRQRRARARAGRGGQCVCHRPIAARHEPLAHDDQAGARPATK